jgi:hypothetical protein
MSLYASKGSAYPWEPYLGSVIQDAITTSQNNVFSNNAYYGPWHFLVHDTGTVVLPAAWQAAPYAQDVGSTFQ